jgi:hypothetical protein
MTEAEWLAFPQVERLWEYEKRNHNAAKTKSGKRKLRLWAAACARYYIGACERRNAADPRLPARREAVGVVERFADGLATRDDLERVRCHETRWLVSTKVEDVLSSSCISYFKPADPPSEEVERVRVATFREVFRNPFRPVAFIPTWRTDTALSLARQMYDSRDFGAMPILADALQDAGCDDEHILAHCRGPGPHVRGCWVVDLVLAKE